VSRPPDEERVAVTGVGVVSPLGVGRTAFWQALCRGQSGLGPVTLFDTASIGSHLAGEVRDFRPEDIVGSKGLRLLDRTTRLALCAASLALEDAAIAPPTVDQAQTAVVLATTFGSASGRGDFYIEAVRGGPRAVNPALFPNTVVNSPASQVAIRFGLRGPNTTVSAGFASSLRALEYAADMIRLGRAQAVLAGGVEELSPVTYYAFAKTGTLSPADAGPERCLPFDRRRNGTVFGEGAVLFVLESLAAARARGARVHAEYRGGASTTDTTIFDRPRPRPQAAVRAIREALARAAVEAGEIGWVASGADGSVAGDRAEAWALGQTLGASERPVVASASKSMLGESFSASGALQAAAAVLGLAEGIVPPTIGFVEAPPRCAVDCVPGTARALRAEHVLVSAVTPLCHHSAAVFSRL
jgi:3-oxoacyl-[acyl-carrier-protein] synthase II